MQTKTMFKLSVMLTAVMLLLSLWAVQFMPVTAQSDSSTNTDIGQELPPEERQALLEQMAHAVTEAPASVSEACTIGSWQMVSPVNRVRSRAALTYAPFNGRFYMLGGENPVHDRHLPIEEYDPVTDTWTDKSYLLTDVSNSGAAAIGQYIYLPGGYTSSGAVDTMQRYNIVADTLTPLPSMPAPRSGHAVVALDNKVYALGGNDTSTVEATNYIYDVGANSWQTGAPLPVAVEYATAVTDGYYIFVIGGNTTNAATVQRYNPHTDKWTLIPDLAAGRGGPVGFFDGRNVWVAGGGWSSYLTSTEYWDGTQWQAGPVMNIGVRTTGAAFGGGIALKAGGWNGGFEDTAEILPIECAPPPPPSTCTIGDWQDIAPLNTPRSRPALTYAESNGRFYLIGGETSGGNRDLPIEEYNADTDTWTDKANLLTGVANTDAVAVGNYIYVTGGYTGTLGTIADLQRYDIQNNSVTTLTAMPTENSAHAAVLHGNKLHVLGGSSNGGAGFTHYIYDIDMDSWTSGSPLLTAVNYPAAASDGTYIYVMGGNTSDLITVQRYDPVTDTWTDAPIMDRGRGGASAFYDGRNIWAVGGGWSSYETSTEYFDGYRWRPGPTMNVGVRTLGAAFGDGMALKAGGWNGTYSDSAEALPVDCAPALALTKSVMPQTAVPYNSVVTYTVTLANSGSASDTNVHFTDTLPLDTTFGTWIEQPSGATEVGGEITWSGTVTYSESITFSFTANQTGAYGDTITNTAEFSGDSGSGSAQAAFTVEPLSFIYLPVILR